MSATTECTSSSLLASTPWLGGNCRLSAVRWVQVSGQPSYSAAGGSQQFRFAVLWLACQFSSCICALQQPCALAMTSLSQLMVGASRRSAAPGGQFSGRCLPALFRLLASGAQRWLRPALVPLSFAPAGWFPLLQVASGSAFKSSSASVSACAVPAVRASWPNPSVKRSANSRPRYSAYSLLSRGRLSAPAYLLR